MGVRFPLRANTCTSLIQKGLMEMAARWYAVSLHSNRESLTRQYLENRNVRCFLPMYSTLASRSDRTMLTQKPLFSGYIFVFIELPGPLKTEVLRCPGVARFVSFSNRPAPIEDDTINSLKILTGAGEDRVNPHPLIRNGQRVKVKEGPFKGADGMLHQPEGKKPELVVEIKLLGRAVSVPILPEQVSPVL